MTLRFTFLVFAIFAWRVGRKGPLFAGPRLTILRAATTSNPCRLADRKFKRPFGSAPKSRVKSPPPNRVAGVFNLQPPQHPACGFARFAVADGSARRQGVARSQGPAQLRDPQQEPRGPAARRVPPRAPHTPVETQGKEIEMVMHAGNRGHCRAVRRKPPLTWNPLAQPVCAFH